MKFLSESISIKFWWYSLLDLLIYCSLSLGIRQLRFLSLMSLWWEYCYLYTDSWYHNSKYIKELKHLISSKLILEIFIWFYKIDIQKISMKCTNLIWNHYFIRISNCKKQFSKKDLLVTTIIHFYRENLI